MGGTSHLSKPGNFARDPRSLRYAARPAFFILSLGLLASCSSLQLPPDGREVSRGPDIMDRVRSVDLLPRFPQQPASADQRGGGAGAKPQVFAGVTVPAVEGAERRSTPSGEGYELNFENTPIASVAKVVLGDILATGYTIDPRVMGMISLSSGRPVPKSDLLFVLENALRLSGVVLVKDVQGYRLIPLGDAVGAGNLDAAEAQKLRDLLAEHGGSRVPGERGPVRGPVRGLARLLRRNPTEAERLLWQALVNDRRFAGRGFKRQVPIGPHIVDFVSFPLKCVIDLLPPQQTDAAARTRAERRVYLTERSYRVCEVRAEDVEGDVPAALDKLAAAID